MRKSPLLTIAILALMAVASCKPNGNANTGSIMEGIEGNEIAGAGDSVATPSLDPVANLKAADDFLTKNRSAPGVKTTASGLQYAIIATGASNGATPSLSSNVQVNYEGKLLDGTIFDSSFARGQAQDLTIGDLITGWKEALQLMRPGDEWTIWVPPSIGYGEAGIPGSVPPNSLLVFRVRLERIVGGSNVDAGVKADSGATK
jgi:FKBP-type peptidyl-prolyl cis-trans isomerase FklB